MDTNNRLFIATGQPTKLKWTMIVVFPSLIGVLAGHLLAFASGYWNWW